MAISWRMVVCGGWSMTELVRDDGSVRGRVWVDGKVNRDKGFVHGGMAVHLGVVVRRVDECSDGGSYLEEWSETEKVRVIHGVEGLFLGFLGRKLTYEL
jgi:hypothetical protein